jgi:hypothetical protein
MNTDSPPNSKVFFSYFINIILLKPISIDQQLVDVLKLDDTQPMPENFEMMSYASPYPTRNLGFNCIWYIVFMEGFIFWWLLKRVLTKCPNARKFLLKIRDKYLTNGFILFLNSTYLFTCVSFFISTSYMKTDTTGNLINFGFSLVLAVIIVAYPIFIGVFYTVNSEKIVRKDPKFLSKWGSLIEPLNYKQGKKVIVYPVLSLLRKLILAATLVYGQEATIFLTILSCII